VRKYLYFIAILPPADIAAEVTSIKQEIFEKYKSAHTLKSPAHITLQKPFSRTEQAEPSLLEFLEKIVDSISPFEIRLSGFGHFENRVLFINVLQNVCLKEVHRKLQQGLKEELNFSEKEIEINFTPHMTVAHKDLSPPMFKAAWQEFQNRKIECSFKAENLCLLKHNDKNWETFKLFNFKESV